MGALSLQSSSNPLFAKSSIVAPTTGKLGVKDVSKFSNALTESIQAAEKTVAANHAMVAKRSTPSPNTTVAQVPPKRDRFLVTTAKLGGKAIVMTCRGYTNVCDTGFAVAAATSSCTKALGRAAISTWNNGLKKTLGSVASTFLGISSYKQGIEAFKLKKDDKREFSERLGELSAHLFNGTCRVATVGVGTCAYVAGNVSNIMEIEAEPNTLLQASKALASGLNTVLSYIPGVCWKATKATGSLLGQLGSTFLENPKICGKGALMAGTVYMTTSHLVKAVDKPGTLNKIYHTGCAAVGIALTVAIAQTVDTSSYAGSTV